MCDRTTLYKDVVKHLRVVRNVAKQHKEAIGEPDIHPDLMTPYERGRMTRSCIKLANSLEELVSDTSQNKIAFAFMLYMDGIGVRGNQFSKPGLTAWSKLWNKAEDFILDDGMGHQEFMTMVANVGNMLDQPLSKVPGRVMLLKLSI